MARTVKEKPWRNPVRKKLERDVEKSCKQWARSNGWWVRKFKAPGNRSVPDDIFAKKWTDSTRKVAVEFKKLGGKSTKKQTDEQDAMRAAGWEVYEIDSFEKFKALFESIEAAELRRSEPLGWLEFN